MVIKVIDEEKIEDKGNAFCPQPDYYKEVNNAPTTSEYHRLIPGTGTRIGRRVRATEHTDNQPRMLERRTLSYAEA